MPAVVRAALAGAYEHAVYRVETSSGSIALRVGRRSAPLERWLAARGFSRGALLSAANPRSVRLSDDANRSRHAQLLARVAELGIPFLVGESADPGGEWREASVLALGVSEEEACELARELDQAALLILELRRPVRLVWT